MVNRNLTWVPFYALFRREIHRFIKVIYQTIAAPLISTLLYLLIFGLSLGQEIRDIHGYPYMAFIIPGLITMAAIRNAFDNASSSIVVSKFCGELEDLKVAPLSLSQIAWAMGLASMIRGLAVSLVTFVMGMLFYRWNFGYFLPIEHPWLLIFFLLFAGFSFGNLGIAILMLAKNLEHVSALSTFILLPLIYLGGVFFSLDHLLPLWKTISLFNPILYIVNGIRYGLLGVSDIALPITVGATILTAISFHLLALIALKRGSYHRW